MIDFVPNYITADGLFQVKLPIEFMLPLLMPAEVKFHREQILKAKIMTFSTKAQISCSRSVYIEDCTDRIFFTRFQNRSARHNIVYFLDELIRIK